MAYTNQQAIEKYLKRELDTEEQAIFPSLLKAIQRTIDRYTGRTFEAKQNELYYDGNGRAELFIDDILTIDEVAELDVDGNVLTTLEAVDYVAYPLNTACKSSIRIKNGGYFPTGHQNIKITGKVGYSENAPEDIQLVANIMLASELTTPSGSTNGLQSENIEGYSRTFASGNNGTEFNLPPLAKSILDSYVKFGG